MLMSDFEVTQIILYKVQTWTKVLTSNCSLFSLVSRQDLYTTDMNHWNESTECCTFNIVGWFQWLFCDICFTLDKPVKWMCAGPDRKQMNENLLLRFKAIFRWNSFCQWLILVILFAANLFPGFLFLFVFQSFRTFSASSTRFFFPFCSQYCIFPSLAL